jgi:hypothetical protein
MTHFYVRNYSCTEELEKIIFACGEIHSIVTVYWAQALFPSLAALKPGQYAEKGGGFGGARTGVFLSPHPRLSPAGVRGTRTRSRLRCTPPPSAKQKFSGTCGTIWLYLISMAGMAAMPSHTAQKASDFLNLPVSQPTTILYYWLGLAHLQLLFFGIRVLMFLRESKTCHDLS